LIILDLFIKAAYAISFELISASSVLLFVSFNGSRKRELRLGIDIAYGSMLLLTIALFVGMIPWH